MTRPTGLSPKGARSSPALTCPPPLSPPQRWPGRPPGRVGSSASWRAWRALHELREAQAGGRFRGKRPGKRAAGWPFLPRSSARCCRSVCAVTSLAPGEASGGGTANWKQPWGRLGALGPRARGWRSSFCRARRLAAVGEAPPLHALACPPSLPALGRTQVSSYLQTPRNPRVPSSRCTPVRSERFSRRAQHWRSSRPGARGCLVASPRSGGWDELAGTCWAARSQSPSPGWSLGRVSQVRRRWGAGPGHSWPSWAVRALGPGCSRTALCAALEPRRP